MISDRIRVLLAKVGLDGHDRGVKVLARAFRDAGMEVIYTGLWQTPAAAVKAAIEEDVDLFGVSFHSAAHRTLVPIIRTELEKSKRTDLPVVLGGIIPADDVDEMKAAGVAAVFGPESSLAEIVETCGQLGQNTKAARRAELSNGAVDGWLRACGAGDRAALGRLLTWIESESDAADAVRRVGERPAPAARCIGITGAPGVGKSTLIGQLLKELRKRIDTVGVIAVDPASPITSGALLGDRARMTASAEDAGVFIRSAASRGQLGGLAPSTGPMAAAMTRAGIGTLIVETVGAGQNDVAVRTYAKPTVLVMMPGAGDELQLDKAGITEIADIFVINKADLAGADRLAAAIRDTFGPEKRVVKTVASHGQGIGELADVLLSFPRG
ncbi:MAG: cobalamin-dependent protein [Phycisphaerae bacterium]|nr:cobalamin-dependent protein [Phycisphaerae bacterium]